MAIDKATIDKLQDPNTVVLVLDGGIDAQIALRWLKQNAPKAVEDERVYEELHIPHLQPAMTVCAAYRRPDTPAFSYHEGPQGSVLSRPRPDAETFAEMTVTKPIKVGDYWQRPNPRSPGSADVSGFLQALNESLLPYRMDYIDKGENKPTILKLRTL